MLEHVSVSDLLYFDGYCEFASECTVRRETNSSAVSPISLQVIQHTEGRVIRPSDSALKQIAATSSYNSAK